MYFPYLRGKQYELIALREFSGFLSENSEKISPIIEPVKDSSTLKSTIKELSSKNINFNIVINPTVGDFIGKHDEILTIIKDAVGDYSDFQIGIIISNTSNYGNALLRLRASDVQYNGISFIHNTKLDNIETFLTSNNDLVIKYNVIDFSKTSRRYYREFERDTIVELEDCFISQQRNADYLTTLDSSFSEEHLYYQGDGFVGFSDFLTIGEKYSDSGFLPYAVAIHLSYTTPSNEIRVKHFVSDSNFDTSDIAGKFAEALEKLVNWCNQENINTYGVSIFKNLHDTGHFPGLGSIKKLSIIHHIELVLNLI